MRPGHRINKKRTAAKKSAAPRCPCPSVLSPPRSELGLPEPAGKAGVSGPPSPGRGAIAHHRSPPSPIPPPAFPAASTVGRVPTVSSRLTSWCPPRIAGDISPIPFSQFYRPVLALYVARALARARARAPGRLQVCAGGCHCGCAAVAAAAAPMVMRQPLILLSFLFFRSKKSLLSSSTPARSRCES